MLNYKKEMNIENICQEYDIQNYTINSNGTVDVDGIVDLSRRNLSKLPLKFGRVTGNFWCHNNKLTTLEGSPVEVGGSFWCYNNNLTSLEGCPREVGGSFWCYKNKLITLEGCPNEVVGSFDCCLNQLTTLEGCPKQVGGHFNCQSNQLTTLESGPKQVGGDFNCNINPLPQEIMDNPKSFLKQINRDILINELIDEYYRS
jgi:hypothetical protein